MPFHPLNIFFTSISRWKSNKSIFCQFDPSNAKIFQYLLTYKIEIGYILSVVNIVNIFGQFTCAHRHNEITSKNEKIRNRISRGKFLVISVSSDSKNVCWKIKITKKKCWNSIINWFLFVGQFWFEIIEHLEIACEKVITLHLLIRDSSVFLLSLYRKKKLRRRFFQRNCELEMSIVCFSFHQIE